jgi:hypothetical protein
MLGRQLAGFAVVVSLFVPSALAAEHTREDAIRFCKDYVREDTVTEKCINDQLATLPLIGCYERVYDAAHLAAHKGQLVARATLSVKSAPPEWQTAKVHPSVATGDLKMWISGRKQSFDSSGNCSVQGDGLFCLGSLSAAEADECRSTGDGVRQCRIVSNDGSFQVERKAAGVLVTIRERLELVQAPYDGGPFLYLSPTNMENHDFLLPKTTPEVCG